MVISCKNESDINVAQTNAFNKMLDDYYEEGLKLNPINATMSGDARYNDILPNPLSNEHQNSVKAYYTKYSKMLTQFDDKNMSESERMTSSILQWECDINLEGFNYNQDLRPVDQMWSPHLFIGQLASGQSAQPFNTVEDYNNWLSRLDGFIDWMYSAEAKMREGIELGHVLPKSLIV